MPKHKKVWSLFRKKRFIPIKKHTVHFSLLSFFFVMDFFDSFLGPRTPLIPRSRFAPSNPLEYSDITKDFWLILVSWALITLCSRFKSTFFWASFLTQFPFPMPVICEGGSRRPKHFAIWPKCNALKLKNNK